MKVNINTSSFGRCSNKPIDILYDNFSDIQLNKCNRRLTTNELIKKADLVQKKELITLKNFKIDLSDNGWTTQSNHSAIGARVILHLFDSQISREIIAGKGHGSMDPLQLHFGLGYNNFINGIPVRCKIVEKSNYCRRLISSVVSTSLP